MSKIKVTSSRYPFYLPTYLTLLISLISSSLISSSLIFGLTIQPATSQSKSNQQGLWNKIFQPTRKPKPPVKPRKGGSRPTQAICLVSPDAPPQPRIIWNTQPLFLWDNGKAKSKQDNPLMGVKKIAVAPFDTPTNNPQYLSTQIVTGKTSITYQGSPLQPGKTYTLSVFVSETSSNSTMFVPFKIMDTKQRDRITKELQLIEKLQKNRRANPEAIALAKTRYFIRKQLWSDAFQQAYSVENPSAELSQLRQELPQQLCNAKDTE